MKLFLQQKSEKYQNELLIVWKIYLKFMRILTVFIICILSSMKCQCDNEIIHFKNPVSRLQKTVLQGTLCLPWSAYRLGFQYSRVHFSLTDF